MHIVRPLVVKIDLRSGDANRGFCTDKASGTIINYAIVLDSTDDASFGSNCSDNESDPCIR